MVESDQAWQLGTESSSERLKYLYTTGEYSDLDIVFPEYETTFKAHRLVLSMSSPVFGTMMTGPLAPGKELPLPQDSPQVFRKLLDHMYLDQMDLESVEEALEVYALAHRYQVESSRKHCLQRLSCNTDSVMSSETVSQLSKETLRGLLKDDVMNFSSEVVPFKVLIAWGKAKLGHQEESSGSALREKIGDLLKEVRFLAMSCDEFVDNVVDTNVLSHTECIHILRAIRGADPSTVPEAMPLNPDRAKRYPKLRGMEHLSLCDLYSDGRDEDYTSFNIGLIENLSCDATIQVHYFSGPYEGKVDIVEVVGSATSEDKLYTFTRPVVLEKDKQYRVLISPSIDILYGEEDVNRDTVENVTLSYSQALECKIYFWRSGDR